MNPNRSEKDWIPLQVPWLGDEEARAAAQAVRDGDLVGGGRIGRRVEGILRDRFGARHALLTTSCTHALELALLALGVGPGDEVILPSFTFPSCANAVVLRGAECVFADLRPGDLNIDPVDAERKITPRTKVLMPMHYAGAACDMDALTALADGCGAAVLEDAAQGVDARCGERYLGTIGDAGCYSFHATKSATCGEGGAFLTNDDALAAKAEIIREKGTNRAAFLRGEVDKYSWVSAGSSYVLSDALAAILEVQIAKLDAMRERRKALWDIYFERLAPLGAAGRIRLPARIPSSRPNWQLFWFCAESPEARDRVLDRLRADGIGATFHYVPLHSAPYRIACGQPIPSLPETTRAAATLVRLPLFPQLARDKAEWIAEKAAQAVLSA